MKPFKSSVLSIRESSSPIQSIDSFVEKKSPLIRLLEFNESIAQADLDSTRDYYISLIKLANTQDPKTCDEVCNAIFNQYEAVKNACSLLNQVQQTAIEDSPWAKIDAVEKALEKTQDYDKKIQIYDANIKTPTRCGSELRNYPIVQYTRKVIKAIETKDLSEIKGYNTLGRDLCNHFGRIMCGVDNVETIDDFIDAYNAIFNLEPHEAYLRNSIQTTRTAVDAINSSRSYIDQSDVGYGSGANAIISTLKINSDIFEDPNDLRMIVRNYCDACMIISILDTKIGMIHKDIVNKIVGFNISAIMHAIEEKNDSFAESMSMFGDEPIDGSNIFDLLDGADFTGSDYMDMSLVADHEMAMTKIAARKEALIKEAMMITEGKIDEVYLLEAGIGAKIKEGFGKIIEFLKNMMKKFVESIMFNFASEKAWLNKYKNVILNNGFDPGTKVTFYCNINNALHQIQKVVPPAISYAELRQKPQDFENEETFFKNRFGNMFPGMDQALAPLNLDANETLANKCKWYLGAKFPNGATLDKPNTFGELKISEMYQWLLDTNKLAKQTQDQLKAIERSVENYKKQSDVLSANQQKKQTQESGTTESVYGYHPGILITEADVETSSNNNNNTATPAAPDSAKPSGNNDQKTDNYKQSSSQAKEEIQNSGDNPNIVAGRMEIYLKVCKAVLSAKATAITYAHKEMLDVMRAIVKGKLGNSADIKLRNMGSDAAPATSNPKPNQNAGGDRDGNTP